MKKLHVGIIGLGVGEQHIMGYQSHPDCEVTTLCDFDDEKIAQAKGKYPAIHITRRADEVLTDPAIDIVSIASYDNHHYEQVIRSIENGKHVFVEKPICFQERELVQIRKKIEENPNIKISSNLILRMSPRFRNLRARIRDGGLGEIYYIEGDYEYGRIEKIHDGWRGRLDYYSVMLGGGIHMVDLLLWLTGDRVTDVSAYGTNIVSRHSNFKYNDMVVAILKFECGLVAKVSANFGCVHPHFHRLSVYGTKATFINGLKNAFLYTDRDINKDPSLIDDPYPGVNKGDLIFSFIDAITKAKEPEVTKEDCFATMSVCLSIERAMRESACIKVKYI